MEFAFAGRSISLTVTLCIFFIGICEEPPLIRGGCVIKVCLLLHTYVIPIVWPP
jgi:hypothetical protein